ncbi:MAG: FAD-dependent thymidylate synthase [bacterium]
MVSRIALLSHTSDPEEAVALAARLCYSPPGITDPSRLHEDRGSSALPSKVISLSHHSLFGFI